MRMTQEIPAEAETADMELENNSALQNSCMPMCPYTKPEIPAETSKIRSKPAI
jgi:hypothetical protein